MWSAPTAIYFVIMSLACKWRQNMMMMMMTTKFEVGVTAAGRRLLIQHDDGSAVNLVQLAGQAIHRLPSTTALWHRAHTVLVAQRSVVDGRARVGATVQIHRRIVGEEAKRLESECHQCVVDRVERQRWLDGTPDEWKPFTLSGAHVASGTIHCESKKQDTAGVDNFVKC